MTQGKWPEFGPDGLQSIHEMTPEEVSERYLRPAARALHEEAVQLCMKHGDSREQAERRVAESLSLVTIGDTNTFEFDPPLA